VGKGTLSIEVTGPYSKLRAFEELLRPYGMAELVRTGTIALPRG
jgi:acetolactate synthase-1/3 small subunit